MSRIFRLRRLLVFVLFRGEKTGFIMVELGQVGSENYVPVPVRVWRHCVAARPLDAAVGVLGELRMVVRFS